MMVLAGTLLAPTVANPGMCSDFGPIPSSFAYWRVIITMVDEALKADVVGTSTVIVNSSAAAGDDSFAASWDWIDVVSTDGGSNVVYRWNAGTSTVSAIDGGPDWARFFSWRCERGFAALAGRDFDLLFDLFALFGRFNAQR